MTLLTRLLPNAPRLHLDAWQTDDTATQLTWRVTSTQALVHGPLCRFPTRRVHRRDVRTVIDLPWGPWRVVLHLQVRKFFGANGRCTRRMLIERLARPLGAVDAAAHAVATPQVIGVGDWAVWKGWTYGTSVIDRERQRPLALRPDRETTTVAL